MPSKEKQPEPAGTATRSGFGRHCATYSASRSHTKRRGRSHPCMRTCDSQRRRALGKPQLMIGHSSAKRELPFCSPKISAAFSSPPSVRTVAYSERLHFCISRLPRNERTTSDAADADEAKDRPQCAHYSSGRDEGPTSHAVMYLMKCPDGSYTLSKVCPGGKPSTSAHPCKCHVMTSSLECMRPSASASLWTYPF